MKRDFQDEKFMSLAIGLAKKGIGKTHPNPAVGAVITKAGKVISSAYHRKAGAMHAEAMALQKAGRLARGATLYGTLEACSHYGKTPPCADAIIKSGIKRAVFSMKDPNPVNSGRGIERLKKAGIKTECGLLEKESSELNRPFIKYMRARLPYVTLKMAQSIDGKIADPNGRSKWITSERSRQLAHKMRSQNDAVMIGVNTLIKDDPLLTDRTSKNGRQPVRVIVDTRLRTPSESRVFSNGDAAGGKVLIAGGRSASPEKKALLEKNGAQVILLPENGRHVDLKALMKHLAGMNITSILCEGGGELCASLLQERLADEALFFISPRIIGGRTSPTSCGGAGNDIKKSLNLRDVSVRRVGEDILVRGLI
ncbi:MAG: bifunctional diaminohydroxyphosphoribosylaminopyrimidine deaminase/5-amino-6-(5-phosphoribosylamino)uracil reductase RibD [Candidatus Omnitrophica bacterium]|nr:bifunctional diaminohydroxyphosphoribosylaminopyrimidine deaminase/5-amino-6-(5-phosphoribosylamino)uracil reductase RibD [Candidatus Omnitrophota bacterium]